MSGAGPGSSSAPPPKNAAEHPFSSRNNLWLDRRGEALPRPYPATPRVDRNREANGQFILTGSQKLSRMREVADSLAGRCGLLELEAFSVNELGEVFEQRESVEGTAEVLVRGFMPQLWKDLALLPADFFRSYQATYLERDVRQVLNVTSLRDFDRFMRAAAMRSGQLLNRTELGKEVGICNKTINEWLSVLQTTNQVTLLETYFANVGKRLVKTPKLYFNDVGLLCFLLGLNRQVVTQSYLIGVIWETLLVGELRKYFRVKAPGVSLRFYRDQSREVDFVIDRNGELALAQNKWKEIPTERDSGQAVQAHPLLPRASWPVMVLCRTRQSHPVAKNALAVNAYRMREHI